MVDGSIPSGPVCGLMALMLMVWWFHLSRGGAMGVSTDGQLCFGVMFDEGFEFPWGWDGDGEFDGDIEEWWRSVNGYVCPMESPWDEDGNRNPGYSDNDPRIDEYFRVRREWLEANPIPVDLVNYCSGDCAMYILTLDNERLNMTARRGYPVVVNVFDLQRAVEETQAERVLLQFMQMYGIGEAGLTDSSTRFSEDGEILAPKWWLSSLWN